MKRANSPDKRKEIRILFTTVSIFVACVFGVNTLAQDGDTTSSGAISISTKAQGNGYYVAADGDQLSEGDAHRHFRVPAARAEGKLKGDIR